MDNLPKKLLGFNQGYLSKSISSPPTNVFMPPITTIQFRFITKHYLKYLFILFKFIS